MAIITVIEATHNIMTRNLNEYQSEHMKTSAKSFTRPYRKPQLLHHNSWDGTPVGRIRKAKFTQSQIKAGLDTILLYVDITDPDAEEKVKNGTYTTVSIGGSAKSVKCGICGTDLLESGWCGHLKGRKYDGKLCKWIIGPMEYDEDSFVNVPADPYGQVLIPDLEAAAKNNEFAKSLLTELLDDERRTETVADKQQSVDELLDEVEALTGNKNGEQPNGNKEGTAPPPDGGTPAPNVVDTLISTIEGFKGKEIKDEKVEKALADIATTLTAVGKALAGESADLDALYTPNAEVEQLKTKLAATEGLLDTEKVKTTELDTKVANLTGQVEKLNKGVLSTAQMIRQVAVERYVDLMIAVENKSPNDRESLAKGLADKKLADLISEAQALSDKLPIPQRESGQAQKPGASGKEGSETLEGADGNGGESNKPKTIQDMEKALGSLFTNGAQR